MLPPAAYADDPRAGSILDIDDSNFPEIRAVVTVSDTTGRPALNLTTASFSAEETGAQASVIKVETVVNQQIPLGVVLTLDLSGSMFGNPIAQAKAAASRFVQDLQPADQAAVISFSSQVKVEDPMTPNRSSTLAAINRLQVRGDTALYDAVLSSVDLASSGTLPRKAIILLTDGQDVGSQQSRDAALARAAQARLPIYTVGLGADIDSPFLQDLARQSGGAFFEAPSASSVGGIYNQLSQLLRTQYVVTLRSMANPNVADRTLRLKVTSATGPIQIDAAYKSKRTIVAPTAEPPPAAVPIPPASTSSGTNLLLGVVGVLIAVGLGFLVLFLYRRWRTRRLAAALEAQSQLAAGELAASNKTMIAASTEAVSVVVDGPNGSSRFALGKEPATIGAGPSCQVRLSDGAGKVSEEQARVWLMDGKAVFHQISSQNPSLLAGKAINWVILDEADRVHIGPYELRIEKEVVLPASG